MKPSAANCEEGPLELAGLTISLPGEPDDHALVKDVTIQVGVGEALAIVGESGSGKSLTAKAIIGLVSQGLEVSGTLRFSTSADANLSDVDFKQIRGRRVGLLMQDPFTILNPLKRIGAHIAEMLKLHAKRRFTKSELHDEIISRLREVGIDGETAYQMFPFQLSGGICQRAALATTLASDPMLLIADEPTTALDAATQKEILDLLRQLRKDRGMSLVLITHDLRVAFEMCDRVSVFINGRVVEEGPTDAVRRQPLHPYTLELIQSELPQDRVLSRLVPVRQSEEWNASGVRAGCCPYLHRCSWANIGCEEQLKQSPIVAAQRYSACIRSDEIAEEIKQALSEHRPESCRAAAGRTDDWAIKADRISKTYHSTAGDVQALKSVSIAVGKGESVGLLGESGSGKTTFARCLLGLETLDQGRLQILDCVASDYGALDAKERRSLRESVQIVFQDPNSTLNPVRSIGSVLEEVVRVKTSHPDPAARVDELLALVGMPPEYKQQMPKELSGGERQRIAIARALALTPEILVLDEPVSALDVLIQSQVLSLLRRLRRELNLSYLLISHDLAVVRQMVDYVYVLLKGQVVEEGSVDEVIDRPEHWYTRKLIDSSFSV